MSVQENNRPQPQPAKPTTTTSVLGAFVLECGGEIHPGPEAHVAGLRHNPGTKASLKDAYSRLFARGWHAVLVYGRTFNNTHDIVVEVANVDELVEVFFAGKFGGSGRPDVLCLQHGCWQGIRRHLEARCVKTAVEICSKPN